MKKHYAILRFVGLGGPFEPPLFRVKRSPRPPRLKKRADPEPVRFDEDDLSPDEARRLRREPGTLLAPAMPVELLRPMAAEAYANATAKEAWGLRAIGASGSHFDGSGVVVAVLDTGIDAAHPAFAGVAIEQRDFTRDGERAAPDVDGHGTHCAGVIFGRDVGGVRVGVARGVQRALVGKVLDDRGRGQSTTIYKGLIWALNEGAHVLSMSVGIDFPGLVRGLVDRGLPDDVATSRALFSFAANVRAFDALMQAFALPNRGFGADPGSVVVAAAGNESRRDVDPDHEVNAALPSNALHVISVGALGESPRGLVVPPYSNTRPLLCAPGEGIVSAAPGGGLAALSGTSMAAPHVAGLAALWWQERLSAVGRVATSDDVIACLRTRTRVDVFAPDVDPDDRGLGLPMAP